MTPGFRVEVVKLGTTLDWVDKDARMLDVRLTAYEHRGFTRPAIEFIASARVLLMFAVNGRLVTFQTAIPRPVSGAQIPTLPRVGRMYLDRGRQYVGQTVRVSTAFGPLAGQFEWFFPVRHLNGGGPEIHALSRDLTQEDIGRLDPTVQIALDAWRTTTATPPTTPTTAEQREP